MTSNNNLQFLRHGLTYGASTGISLLVLMGVLYMFGQKELIVTGLGHYLILSYGIHTCQQKWKKSNIDATYGKLLLIGLVCGASASIFVDLYAACYAKMLNPSYVDDSIAQSMEAIRGMNIYGPNELSEAAGITRKLFVASLAMGTTIAYTVISLILSAIFAFFTNKKIQKQ